MEITSWTQAEHDAPSFYAVFICNRCGTAALFLPVAMWVVCQRNIEGTAEGGISGVVAVNPAHNTFFVNHARNTLRERSFVGLRIAEELPGFAGYMSSAEVIRIVNAIHGCVVCDGG